MKAEREEFLEDLNVKLLTVEKFSGQSKAFVERLKNYLNGKNSVGGTQELIGYKYIFQGFIVRDWDSNKTDEMSFSDMNRVIITVAVKFYLHCW